MGRLGLTETGSWTMHELRVNFTITRFEGGFSGLTSELINDLLNLGAPEFLEAAWPTLEPVVIEMIYGVRLNMRMIFSLTVPYLTFIAEPIRTM